MYEYYDKYGIKIEEGMLIRHADGGTERVYSSGDDLGINASNEGHVDFENLFRKIYPLSQFNLREWEVVKEG